jgi:hypothetical protein
MEEMSLIVAVGVPYEVEITSTGIPMHETDVEFCVLQNDVRYAFPAKNVNDTKFIFTITDAVSHLVNKTLDYKLCVYYGNARFEADRGSFNLLDKKAFDVKMKKDTDVPTKTSLAQRLTNKTAKKTTATPEPTATPEATPKVTKKVTATKPTPTPEVTPTTTLKEAKKALNESSVSSDKSKQVREILAGLSKTATPTHKIQTTATATPEPTEPITTGSFFESVAEIRKTNEQRNRRKKIREVIHSAKKKKDD